MNYMKSFKLLKLSLKCDHILCEYDGVRLRVHTFPRFNIFFVILNNENLYSVNW